MISMDLSQKEVIEELKQEAKRLGHTPKQRELSNNLLWNCYKHFGSFNKTKQRTGLSIVNVRRTTFPKGAFKPDEDLAHIASYLTFDGHIYKTLKGMMFSSKNIKDLQTIEKIFKRKFGIDGSYYLNSAGSKWQTHKFCIFNKRIASEFYNLEIPKGEKVMQDFRVPKWIKNSQKLSRKYLEIAFLCEGSFSENNRKNPRIQINIAKGANYVGSGIKFMEDLRDMLLKLDIKTTNINFMGENQIRRKDGEITKNIRFRVITEDNNKFIK
jgi:hypothetical protein